jgi:hypothetical protein
MSQIEGNFQSSHQPGGTLTAIVDNWSSRIRGKGQDPFGLGRWSYISLKGKQDQVITIISAYRIPQKSASSIGKKQLICNNYVYSNAKYWIKKERALLPNLIDNSS